MVPELHDTGETYAGAIVNFQDGGRIQHLVDEWFLFDGFLWLIDPTWQGYCSHFPNHLFGGEWLGENFICNNRGGVVDARMVRIVDSGVRRYTERNREAAYALALRDYERRLSEITSNA